MTSGPVTSTPEGGLADLPANLPLAALEEHVVFSEWAALRTGSSRSLERTRMLMEALGYDPAGQRHTVLGVVGSKGKGTAAAYASATLAGLAGLSSSDGPSSGGELGPDGRPSPISGPRFGDGLGPGGSPGYAVGTVMSPGVLSNADRIRLDGRAVEEHIRRAALLRIEEAKQSLPAPGPASGYLAPTGLFLLMGFLIFAEAGVNAVVAEAGIGGSSDDLSHWPLDGVVLTSVFGEHLDLLGPTVTDVARDKAGVIGMETQFVVSLGQSEEVARELRLRCQGTGTQLIWAPEQGETPASGASAPAQKAPDTGTTAEQVACRERIPSLTAHLPSGFQRANATAGILAGLTLSRGLSGRRSPHSPRTCHQQAPAGPERQSRGEPAARETKFPPELCIPELCTFKPCTFASCTPEAGTLADTVRSVQYPGRLSVHEVPGAAAHGAPRRCVVDSAVSGEGVAAALDFTSAQLGDAHHSRDPGQVLVCLPPSKDLTGFIDALSDYAGDKTFVELPGAYIGTPERSAWPGGPGWDWVRLEDLDGGVHEAAASEQLLELLRRADSLAIGTVLFTSLVLRTLGADAEKLFNTPTE